MRPVAILLPLALLLPGGCCSMARLFCGPDTTPWVPIDYSTPERTVRTFLEALRRDQPEVVYEATSAAFRDRYQLDKATLQVAWPRVKEENPYLHVAGYAEVPAATKEGDRASLVLTIAGRRLRIDLVRQKKWEVRYPLANGAIESPGAYVTTFAQHLTLTENDTGTRATLTPAPLTWAKGVDEIAAEELQFAGFVAEWKVSAVTLLADA